MDTEKLKNKETDSFSASPMNLAELITSVILLLKQEKKRPAVHTYTATLHSYVTFAEEKGFPLTLTEVFTAGRLKEYEEYLRDHSLAWNTVSTYMRTLRAVYRRILPAGHPEHNPLLFKDVHTKVESLTKRALTEEDMNKVISSANSNTLPVSLHRALAYFSLLFQLRGMPFIDLCHLQKKDLQRDAQGNYILTYCRHKTGKQMRVQVPREAVELLKTCRSKDPDSIYLFPILENRSKKKRGNGQEDELKNNTPADPQKTTDNDDVYHYYQRALGQFNKALASLAALLLPPGMKLSSYTARHSWATIAYHKGVPIGIISKALGHSSIRVTENYLKPFSDEEVDKVNEDMITGIVRQRVANYPFTGL
ncbi:MAG: site-specific integrase [Bacteroides sp.]|nr:site-specific integrase [Bacteroides sp.]